jgi:formate/nitrite transporter FocA (FNT family)
VVVVEENMLNDIVENCVQLTDSLPITPCYTVALGMMLGADISITRLLFQALLPATLGNLVGGGLMIGGVYWYVFDSMDTIINFREKIQHGRKRSAIGK